jgi:bacteriocin-like protein
MYNIFKKTKKGLSAKIEQLNSKELKNVLGGSGDTQSGTTSPEVEGSTDGAFRKVKSNVGTN